MLVIIYLPNQQNRRKMEVEAMTASPSRSRPITLMHSFAVTPPKTGRGNFS